MYVGQYNHHLDHKSRTSIPKKFREQLNKKAILTRGLDGCLFLYSEEEWGKLSQRFSQLPLTATDARAFSRYIFGNAIETTFDSLGRIMIPDYLATYAGLKKEIVIVGVLNRIEIWSRRKFETVNIEISKKSQEIAEKLTDSGV